MTILKNISLTGLFCLLVLGAFAQDNPHPVKVRIGYGFWSLPDLGGNLFSAWTDIERENDKVIGPFHLGLSYNFNRNIELGFSWTYNRIREEGRYKPGKSPGSSQQDPNRIVEVLDSRYTSVMLYINGVWRHEGKLKYYSGGATGLSFVNRDEWFQDDQRPRDSYDVPGFQITAVGVSYGDRVQVYGEVGFGMYGLFNGGVVVRL